MKKITTAFVAIVALLLLNNNVNAQAFQKGNINVDVGIGIGAYGTQSTTTTELSFTAFGIPFSETAVHDTTDGAASTIIPINFEYGISDKFGLGADLTIASYFIDKEDKEYISSVRAVEFGVKGNYHLLNSDRNDLFIGIGLGMSSINWKFKTDVNNIFGLTAASGTGIYYSIGITDRIFFSDHIGILFNLGYRGYSYSSIEYDVSEGTAALTAFGVTDLKYSQKLEWKLSGVHFGTGIAVKF